MHRDTIRIAVTLALLVLAAALVAVALATLSIPVELVVAVSFVAVGWIVVDRVLNGSASPGAQAPTTDAFPDVRRSFEGSGHAPRAADQTVTARTSGSLELPDALADSLEAELSVVPLRATERTPHLESVEPAHIVGRLAESLGDMSRTLSVGLWLEDAATATLRLVAGAGEISPADDPLPCDTAPVSEALSATGEASAPLSDITDHGDTTRVWRYARGITAGAASGAIVADVALSPTESGSEVQELLRAWTPYLGAALELHVARHDASVAHELIEAARDLSRSIDPDAVLDSTLDRAVLMAEAETGSIMLVGEDGSMKISRSVGLPEDVVQSTVVTPGEGIAGWVLATDKPLLVEDLPGHSERSARRGVRSAVSVPISDEEGTIGVLNVGSRVFPARFTQAHLDAMEVLGRQACVAYRNAQAVGEARDLYLSTLRTLSVAMETKDPYARGCTERVLDGVSALARAMNLSEDERRSVEIAALFHDMGMAAAGDGVRSLDRPLTTIERGLLKMHPVIAAEVLDEAPALRDVAAIVYHHHERFDGHGYVGGLQGTTIPVGARILAVVDAYVAMTTARPYRTAMDAADAVKELKMHAGTQFDPIAVEAFVKILGEEGIPAREDVR